MLWQLKGDVRRNHAVEPVVLFDGELKPGRFFVEDLLRTASTFINEGRYPKVRMSDLQTPCALEWTIKGVRGSAPPKCIIKQLPGPEGERKEYLRVLSALGERLAVPYGGSGEGVFVTECIRQLLRCARVPTDLEKTCCAWCCLLYTSDAADES